MAKKAQLQLCGVHFNKSFNVEYFLNVATDRIHSTMVHAR